MAWARVIRHQKDSTHDKMNQEMKCVETRYESDTNRMRSRSLLSFRGHANEQNNLHYSQTPMTKSKRP